LILGTPNALGQIRDFPKQALGKCTGKITKEEEIYGFWSPFAMYALNICSANA